MTKPRRHDPEQARESWRIRDQARDLIDAVEETRDDPWRASRNPCDNPDCGLHWADPETAAHIRATGLPPDDREEAS
ncbi:hypothetical protein ABZ949_02200 [Micromonospora tulbaghiae]|uniref:hypothetical protein n=1 Tax=Micromonospora tulbaghiae TaxID=479978 RepID=UPI003410793D